SPRDVVPRDLVARIRRRLVVVAPPRKLEVVDAGLLAGFAYRRVERVLAGFDEPLRAIPVAVRTKQKESCTVRGLAHDDDAGGKLGSRRHRSSIVAAGTRARRLDSISDTIPPCAAAIRRSCRPAAAPSRRRAPDRSSGSRLAAAACCRARRCAPRTACSAR